MAKKRQKNTLPSGNVRIKVYDYTDSNGKQHYKSFTAPTKAEAQALAAEAKVKETDMQEGRLTLYEACSQYIAAKSSVLSPSTVSGYNVALKRIGRFKTAFKGIDELTSLDLQTLVTEMNKTVSPKTVSNTFGFISASLKLFAPDKSYHVTLPQRTKVRLYIPNKDDVQLLINACKTDEMKLAILFAAVGTMRRGEACAVTFNDVDYEQCTIHVNKAYVKVDDKYWELKAPKTYESDRFVKVPQYVIDMIKGLKRNKGFVLGLNPDQLYDRFANTLNKTGLPHFRYHDLRHYAASQLHACGVPDRYIEAMGGWKPGSNVLKRVYENVLDSELVRMQELFMDKNSFTT